MSTLKVLSLFSGIGAFEKALTNLGINFELVGFSEIDKYAIESYCAIHNTNKDKNLGDVSKINKELLPDFDLLVGGSPCQSFSIAGHRKGFEDTRGTLFFQYVETLKHKRPKYFLYENVKGLINHDKGNTLNVIANAFNEVGYRIDLELLNSKYFNVPQNRERIFIVGIREDLIENQEWEIDGNRKDVLMNGKIRLKELGIKTFNFKYPKQKFVTKRLRDILEDNVDEKFYISKEKSEKLIRQLEENNKSFNDKTLLDPSQSKREGCSRVYEDISPTLNSRDYKDPRMVIDECNMVGRLEMKGNDYLKRVYNPDGVSPTLTTMGGGNTEPKIVVEEVVCLNTYQDNGKQTQQQSRVYDTNGQMTSLMASQNGRFNVLDVKKVGNVNPSGNGMNGQVYDSNGLAPTVTTNKGEGTKITESSTYRIRKLTPKECWRLMGFYDEDFEKAAKINSNSQLYKQAGNSIVVNVLEQLFTELLNTYNK